MTKNRDHFFGEIVGDKMVLNEIEKILKNEWLISEKIRKNIFLDEFVIMPKHFHGIVIIDNERDDDDDDDAVDVERNYDGKNKFMSDISPKKSSLSHMIRSFKSVVTKNSQEINSDFALQTRFHDRIIRY